MALELPSIAAATAAEKGTVDKIRQLLELLGDEDLRKTLEKLVGKEKRSLGPTFSVPPGVQGFAPQGLVFPGGSPFPMDQTPFIILNAASLVDQLQKSSFPQLFGGTL